MSTKRTRRTGLTEAVAALALAMAGVAAAAEPQATPKPNVEQAPAADPANKAEDSAGATKSEDEKAEAPCSVETKKKKKRAKGPCAIGG